MLQALGGKLQSIYHPINFQVLDWIKLFLCHSVHGDLESQPLCPGHVVQ